MTKFVQSLRGVALLLVRVGLGAILVLHGWTHWQLQGAQRQIDYLTLLHAPSPAVAAWTGIIFEFVGGLFLIVGFLTPLMGLGVLIQQILIIAYTNWAKWPALRNPDGSYNGGYEYNVALGLLGLVLLCMGGGLVAVDQLFRRRKSEADEDTPDRVPAHA
jgi:putative oxidoreductase